MTITDIGKKRAEEIVFGLRDTNSKDRKEQNISKENVNPSSKSVKRESYSIANLELSDEQRIKLREMYTSISPKSQNDQIVLLCYLLKEIKDISNCNPDIVYTALRIVDEKTPKVLSQTLRDIKSKKQYLDKNQDGTYSLNHIGEDFVRFSLLQGVNE